MRNAPSGTAELLIVILLLTLLVGGPTSAQSPIEILRPTGGLSDRVCNQLAEPIALVQASDGRYLLLDRRAHTVYTVDSSGTKITKVLEAGMQKGEVLQPAVLSLAPDDSYAVTDAPFRQERIQVFTAGGTQIRAFLRPGLTTPRLTMGPLILDGIGSLQFTGTSFYINAPDTGALVSELDLDGGHIRHFGTLRATGHEHDTNIHLAMNIGLALPGRDGSVTFVFQTGVPMFRKYDATGTLVFERHIEGPHLDSYLQQMPTTWPTRTVGDRTYPIVASMVRTAALDPDGNLWVSLIAPYTYVYDRYGEKRRTVQFDGTSGSSPVSLTFSRAPGPTRALVLPGCYAYGVE